MDSYRAKFEALLATFEKNPAIELTKKQFGSVISIEALKASSSAKNFPQVPAVFYEFYASIGGSLQLSWTCDLIQQGIPLFEDSDTELKGEIHILPFQNLAEKEPKVNSKKYYRHFEEEELEDVPYFRLIERWNDVINVGFLIDSTTNVIEDELYYLDADSDGFGFLSIPLQDYLDALLLCKGFSGWQYNYFIGGANRDRMDHYLNVIFG